MKDDIKSSTTWDALPVTSLVSSISPLRLIICCEELTALEMKLLFRFVNFTINRSAVVLEPTNWLENNLGLALALSLAPSENASVQTKNS